MKSSILKQFNLNRFFFETTSIISILLISLIPWLDFLNINQKEFDTIFNDSFFLLLYLYFLIIFILYLAFKFLTKTSNTYAISLLGFSIWLFFQYNFIEKKFSLFLGDIIEFKNKNYSSETTFIFILFIIIVLIFFLNKKKFLKTFVLFFLFFNFIYSNIIFIPSLVNFIYQSNFKISEKTLTSKNSINIINKPNIYFFIIDAMKPLNEFEDYYKEDLKSFKNFYNEKNYKYYENTKNLYRSTEYIMASFFRLSEIPDQELNDSYKRSKTYFNNTFPALLKSKLEPNLIKELNEMNYKFNWLGNVFANCSKINYKYCLNSKKETYIDIYLLQAFLNKTPFIQIFNIIADYEIIKKKFNLNNTQDSILELNKYLKSNKDIIGKEGSNFFFIHDIQTHEPHTVDSNCEYARYPGKYFVAYRHSYLCSIKKISKVIETLSKYDPNSIVIFQSDHNWKMSLKSEEQYGRRENIFNLIKNNIACTNKLPDNPNNINILNYMLSCLKSDRYSSNN
jgi:hypothetical protein